jgi:hypothetical protein
MEGSPEAGVTIRWHPMHEQDMACLAALSVELGYPKSEHSS